LQFRIVTLNLEQDHKRWSDRHPLISAEIAALKPDVIAFNEVSVPLQTAKMLRDAAIAATGIRYKLVQQTRVNGLSKVEGEADSLRLFQVQQLLAWIETRADGTPSVVCGDFNASLDAASAGLMATRFRPTQSAPTAFTPLADRDGTVSHPYWPRMDRCIDYIWISEGIEIVASEVCFDRRSPDDPSLWPSDHAGVWADLQI
jgi:endonuclease/exonuclease/phosphatase family metal-dependent hydrolase